MLSRKRTRLRPAEGWPKDWYYSGEVDTVNIEALLDPDEYFNRVILGREVKPRPEAEEARPPDSSAAPRRESKA